MEGMATYLLHCFCFGEWVDEDNEFDEDQGGIAHGRITRPVAR